MTSKLTPLNPYIGVDRVAHRLSTVCPLKDVYEMVENSLRPNIMNPLIHSQCGVHEMLDTLYWSMLDETE